MPGLPARCVELAGMSFCAVRIRNRTGVADAGRRIALSRPRRLLTDLSHLSRGFPRATLLTRIDVAALVEPRDQARIPWPVVFAKAYALVAAGSPPLRRVYVKLPWPHLYELRRRASPASSSSVIGRTTATAARRRCSSAG